MFPTEAAYSAVWGFKGSVFITGLLLKGISMLTIDPSGRATTLSFNSSNLKQNSRLCINPLNPTEDKGVCFNATPENQQSTAGNNLPALQLAQANKKNNSRYTHSSLLEL